MAPLWQFEIGVAPDPAEDVLATFTPARLNQRIAELLAWPSIYTLAFVQSDDANNCTADYRWLSDGAPGVLKRNRYHLHSRRPLPRRSFIPRRRLLIDVRSLTGRSPSTSAFCYDRQLSRLYCKRTQHRKERPCSPISPLPRPSSR